MNLWRILVSHIKPHWQLLMWVLVFQVAQSVASLSLPDLNANIIDKGVATGNIPYILSTGTEMLIISLGQVIGSIAAVYFGARLKAVQVLI